jgi:hypothetical protein
MKRLRPLLKVVGWLLLIGGPLLELGIIASTLSLTKETSESGTWFLMAIGALREAVSYVAGGGVLLLLISIDEKLENQRVLQV